MIILRKHTIMANSVVMVSPVAIIFIEFLKMVKIVNSGMEHKRKI